MILCLHSFLSVFRMLSDSYGSFNRLESVVLSVSKLNIGQYVTLLEPIITVAYSQ
jgi:hypothetical protein